MAITTRAQFKDYILRKLGSPMIEINVEDDQVEDRITEALTFYNTYHFDGAEKSYYSYAVTPTDRTNRYIDLPANVIGAARVFPVGTYMGVNNMFNIRYQIALNDMYTLTNVSLVPWYMNMQQLQFMEQLLVGEVPIRYTRTQNRLYLDMDWAKVNDGNYLLIEVYKVIDPDTYTRVYDDIWLQRYAAALVKKQWGAHLTKFVGMSLTGGVQFNAEKIYDDAVKEIEELEQKFMSDFNVVDAFYVG